MSSLKAKYTFTTNTALSTLSSSQVKQKPYLKAPSDDLDPETAAKIAWENHKMRNASIMVELFDVSH